MPRVHLEFEWDDGKDAINTDKHGLTFDEAAYVLADPWGHVHHFNMIDTRHDEERYASIGVSSAATGGPLVRMVHRSA